jgi:hypothetical protein
MLSTANGGVDLALQDARRDPLNWEKHLDPALETLSAAWSKAISCRSWRSFIPISKTAPPSWPSPLARAAKSLFPPPGPKKSEALLKEADCGALATA